MLAKIEPNNINVQANLEERKGNLQVPEIKGELKDRTISLCPDPVQALTLG